MPLEKCAYKIEKSKGRNLVSRMYAGFHSDVNPAIFVCFFHLMHFFFDFLVEMLFFLERMIF